MRQILAAAMLASAPLALSANGAAAQTADPGPQWTLEVDAGPPVATYSVAGEVPLVSAGCDEATGEIVLFRAVDPPVAKGKLTLTTETGSIVLEAAADPSGTPGVIARAPASDPLMQSLASAATITFRVTGEEENASGLAAPVEEPLRQIVSECGG